MLREFCGNFIIYERICYFLLPHCKMGSSHGWAGLIVRRGILRAESPSRTSLLSHTFTHTSMLSTVELFDDAALTALIASATLLGTDLKAGLFTNQPVISKQNVIADFTEPTYASYVRQSVVMGAPFRDPLNGISALSAALTWQETGSVTPVTIYGIFYTYGTVPLLLGAEMFETPQNLLDLLSAFETVLQYVQSNENAGFTTLLT